MAQLRPEGVATFRDVQPRQDELPVACQELFRHSLDKVKSLQQRSVKPRSSPKRSSEITLPTQLMDLKKKKKKKKERMMKPIPGTTLDVNEHEGPSFGKTKASHPAPKPEAAKQPAAVKPAPAPVPQAAATGAPSPENVEDGTVRPKHKKGSG